jgi:hypothetical protein
METSRILHACDTPGLRYTGLSDVETFGDEPEGFQDNRGYNFPAIRITAPGERQRSRNVVLPSQQFRLLDRVDGVEAFDCWSRGESFPDALKRHRDISGDSLVPCSLKRGGPWPLRQ